MDVASFQFGQPLAVAVVPVAPSAGVSVIPPVSDVPQAAAAVASRLSLLEAGHLAVIQALNDTVRKVNLHMYNYTSSKINIP